MYWQKRTSRRLAAAGESESGTGFWGTGRATIGAAGGSARAASRWPPPRSAPRRPRPPPPSTTLFREPRELLALECFENQGPNYACSDLAFLLFVSAWRRDDHVLSAWCHPPSPADTLYAWCWWPTDLHFGRRPNICMHTAACKSSRCFLKSGDFFFKTGIKVTQLFLYFVFKNIKDFNQFSNREIILRFKEFSDVFASFLLKLSKNWCCGGIRKVVRRRCCVQGQEMTNTARSIISQQPTQRSTNKRL